MLHVALLQLALAGGEDLRTLYDVQAYRLDLALDPRTKTLTGTVAVEARVTGEALSRLVLDLKPGFKVESVTEIATALEPQGPLAGTPVPFQHERASLACLLPNAKKKGDRVCVAVKYSGRPTSKDAFSGFHWKKTAAGEPWISTSCQDDGSSSWWPGKDSYWHPEDKPERTFLNVTVPAGLFAVANGRLAGRETGPDGTETFHWVHDYPCETYAIAIAAAPYVVVEQDLELAGEPDKLRFAYYVLPEDEAKARLQFQDVPRMLEIFGERFGPYPFPKSKFALVETSFWGMEHSTCVAYGSSFPAWCKANDQPDRYAQQNRLYDYILVHESAHEWWGNAVSAKSWGHFWIHEGFATYAEAVYLEGIEDRDAVDEWFEAMKPQIRKDSRIFRGENVDSGQAYAHVVYGKGAWVLNTLRHYVDDDEAWWRAVRGFQLAARYGNADTDDFRASLEKETRKGWKPFFDEWVYGEGYPEIDGTVTAQARAVLVEIENKGTGNTGFHVPLDIAWRDGKEKRSERVTLAPGTNRIEIPCKAKPRDVEVGSLDRVLGNHSVRLE